MQRLGTSGELRPQESTWRENACSTKRLPTFRPSSRKNHLPVRATLHQLRPAPWNFRHVLLPVFHRNRSARRELPRSEERFQQLPTRRLPENSFSNPRVNSNSREIEESVHDSVQHCNRHPIRSLGDWSARVLLLVPLRSQKWLRPQIAQEFFQAHNQFRPTLGINCLCQRSKQTVWKEERFPTVELLLHLFLS